MSRGYSLGGTNTQYVLYNVIWFLLKQFQLGGKVAQKLIGLLVWTEFNFIRLINGMICKNCLKRVFNL